MPTQSLPERWSAKKRSLASATRAVCPMPAPSCQAPPATPGAPWPPAAGRRATSSVWRGRRSRAGVGDRRVGLARHVVERAAGLERPVPPSTRRQSTNAPVVSMVDVGDRRLRRVLPHGEFRLRVPRPPHELHARRDAAQGRLSTRARGASRRFRPHRVPRGMLADSLGIRRSSSDPPGEIGLCLQGLEPPARQFVSKLTRSVVS